jgi:hypothetical protein
MRYFTRFFLFALLGSIVSAQGTASLQFTQTFTTVTTGGAVSNGPTAAGGPQGSVAFRMVYYIQPGSGTVSALSVELDGAPTSGGSYTALTPAVGGGAGAGSTTNPVTTSPEGQGVMCCDFYPFLKIKVNTLTVLTGTPVLIVKVLGYAGTSAAAEPGGGGAPSGAAGGDLSGNYPDPSVVGIDAVPLCTGFAPMNGQFLKYTTAGSPNPCYTAAVPTGTGGFCSTGQFMNAISGSVVPFCATPSYPAGAVIGTARFNPSGGSIAGLVKAGDVSNVIYNSVGQYTISLSGSPSNYLPMVTIGNDAGIASAEVNPVGLYGAVGFAIAVVLNVSGYFDPALVFVVVIKL